MNDNTKSVLDSLMAGLVLCAALVTIKGCTAEYHRYEECLKAIEVKHADVVKICAERGK